MAGFWQGSVYRGDGTNEDVRGGGGNETLRGAGGADTLNGGGGDDSLDGGEGADSLGGGLGVDVLNGGAGNDIISYNYSEGDAKADRIVGGAGNDYLSFSVSEGKIGLTASSLKIDGQTAATFSGVERLSVAFFSEFDHVVRLGASADSVTTGAGDDTISLGAGDDNGRGNGGDDVLSGGAGDDTLDAGDGGDTVDGGAGDDRVGLQAGGRDDVDLGDGADTLFLTSWSGSGPSPGRGRYDGGAGIDAFHIDLDFVDMKGVAFRNGVLKVGSLVVAETSGFESYNFTGPFGQNSAFSGGAGDDVATGGQGNQTFKGGVGDDSLSSVRGADKLYGDAGNDTLRATLDAQADTFAGGAGVDLLDLRADFDFDADIVISGDLAKTATLTGDGKILARISGIEAISITTGAGDDSLVSGAGDDSLGGGDGRNVVRSGAGDDKLSVDLDATVDYYDGGIGDDVADIANFSDGRVVMSGDSKLMTVTLGGVVAARIANVESFSLFTGDADDSLLGGVGDDYFSAAGGANVMRGGAGDDSFYFEFDAKKDVVVGGAGNDDVSYSAGSGSVVKAQSTSATGFDLIRDGKVVLQATGVERVDATGTDGNDTLVGLSGDDLLRGGAGADRLIGGAGIDTADFVSDFGGVSVKLIAGKTVTAKVDGKTGDTLTGIENLKGTFFADTLIGDSGDNVITDSRVDGDVADGGAGVDTFAAMGFDRSFTLDLANDSTLRNFENVRGSYWAGGDTLIGNSKANRIESGGGADTMTGGAGADVFSYSSFSQSVGGDFHDFAAEITDFSKAQKDKIHLADMVGDDEPAWTFLGLRAFTGAENELRYLKEKTATYVLADFDGDKQADFAIQLNGAQTLAGTDFIL